MHAVMYELRAEATDRTVGPLIGRWNFFLERNFPLRPVRQGNSGQVSFRALARRVGADQFFMSVPYLPSH